MLPVGKTECTMRRAVWGTVGGAVFGATIAAGVTGLLFGLPLLAEDVHPMDREHDLQRFPHRLVLALVGGSLLGGLAGFASHWPQRGLPLPRPKKKTKRQKNSGSRKITCGP